MGDNLYKASDILYKDVLRLSSCVALIQGVLTLVFFAFYFNLLSKSNADYILNTVKFYKSDLLTDLALSDTYSVQKGLDLIKRETRADKITLIQSDESFAQSVVKPSFFEKFYTTFYVLDSEFKNTNAAIKIKYYSRWRKEALYPSLIMSVFIFALTTFAFVLVFYILVRRTEKSLVNPIKEIADKLKARESTGKYQPIKTNIEEVKLLVDAIDSFKTVEKELAFNQVARQVAHDIRSPLSALNVLAQKMTEVDEMKRDMIRRAANRISDIAQDLVEKGKRRVSSTESSEVASTESIPSAVASIVTEKRALYQSNPKVRLLYPVTSSHYCQFAKVQRTELKRVVSNIINNATEALPEKGGSILVQIGGNKDYVEVEISDDGRGIPRDKIERIFEQGFTDGKTGGSGLGLYHARKIVESWGGAIDIVSKVNVGTNVTIRIPKTSPPPTFVDKVTISAAKKIIVADDDPNIHDVWKHRFKEIGLMNRVFHFFDPEQLSSYLENYLSYDNLLFLIDYEFVGYEDNGLDLIKKHSLSNDAYLVTSRHEEDEIRKLCQQYKIGLIDKSFAHYVPIESIESLSMELNL